MYEILPIVLAYAIFALCIALRKSRFKAKRLLCILLLLLALSLIAFAVFRNLK